jgi:hypothetical protein
MLISKKVFFCTNKITNLSISAFPNERVPEGDKMRMRYHAQSLQLDGIDVFVLTVQLWPCGQHVC